MDLTTRLLTMGAAGAGGAEKAYVEDVFSTWLYTGSGSTQTITNGIDLAGEGGLVWLKNRSSATSHRLSDTARGVNKQLSTNQTAAETSYTTFLTGFNADGFNVATDSDVNANGLTYASWTFRKAPGFFDVVTYTGNGSNRTIAHNLGSVPGCMIVKQTSAAGQNWVIYHRGLVNPEQKYLLFNTSGEGTLSTVWNNTAPTSTVFTVGTDIAVNQSGQTYVAYLFAHDEQIFGESGDQSVIKCGSYTGNGSTNGPVIDLGWEPQWVLIKAASASGNWTMFDTMRGIVAGGDDPYLQPNTSLAENPSANFLSLTSTGFQLVTTANDANAAGTTYVYIAIRRGPMKTPEDAAKLFNSLLYTGSSSAQTISGAGFVPDSVWLKCRTAGANNSWWFDRLRGLRSLDPPNLQAENNRSPYFAEITMNGFRFASGSHDGNSPGQSHVGWCFKRAPSVFDFVAYTGTGSARTLNHNLGVAPELIVIKNRGSDPWTVYNNTIGISNYLSLGSNAASTVDSGSSLWNGTNPTSTVFSVKDSGWVNGTGGQTYIAYLFASCPGVSKVGSYTGTGTTQQINCGFTSGARFVMIKRTDSTGDWYMWDSARGIVSGNDPYVLANQLVNETTGTDYIDPLNSGFEISSTAPAAINANGGSFIFLAIA